LSYELYYRGALFLEKVFSLPIHWRRLGGRRSGASHGSPTVQLVA